MSPWAAHASHAVTDGFCEACHTAAREFAITLSCQSTPPATSYDLSFEAHRIIVALELPLGGRTTLMSALYEAYEAGRQKLRLTGRSA